MNNNENNHESQFFDCLAVTNVQVFPFSTDNGKQKALANIVLNDQFLIRGFRIVDGENGLFVGYPVDPFTKGEDFRSQCMPLTRALRDHIENVVLEKYTEMISKRRKCNERNQA